MTKYISKTMNMMDWLMVIRFSDKKTAISITIQKTFLSSYKNIILIFSLVITTFLPRYKNIVLIFFLVKTSFLLGYKNIF